MKRFFAIFLMAVLVVILAAWPVGAASVNSSLNVNVLLNTAPTDSILATLGSHGLVAGVIDAINAVTMRVNTSELTAVRALPFVVSANPDAARQGAPVDTVATTDFTNGISTWNLDAINVTQFGTTDRQVAFDGTGVYIAVLDTGLLDTWRQYFPQERIAVEYARSFGGGGADAGNVSMQPMKWQHDQDSHGTHVTSTILGYQLGVNKINGVAPKATIIPVKVLNQNGSGWSSVIAAGIVYVADLKANELAGSPVVINMSLGGSALDAVEKAAIDYAISQGVIIVASAGNRGTAGMGYPGAYAPVISVAASGWTGEWQASSWWTGNVPDPTDSADFYITDFSSRALAGQDLDVAAPGSWIVGPYQNQSGKTSYYYLGGTSMASPHVAGIVALMAQKCPNLKAPAAEVILERSAVKIAAGSQVVTDIDGSEVTYSWGTDATGAGLANAAAAVAATPEQQNKSTKNWHK